MTANLPEQLDRAPPARTLLVNTHHTVHSTNQTNSRRSWSAIKQT